MTTESTTPPGTHSPEPSALERLGLGAWNPSFRDIILTLGFIVVLAGSIADIAHYLDGRDSTTASVPASVAVSDDTGVGDPVATPAVTSDEQPSVAVDSPGDAAAEPTAAVLAEAGTYIVAAGDVLYEIAVRHGTTPQVLADLNGLDNPNRIEVGQVLLVPDADGS